MIEGGKLAYIVFPGQISDDRPQEYRYWRWMLITDIAAMRRNSFPDKKKLADRPSVIEGIFFMAEEQHSAHMKQLCRRHIIFVPERRKNICALKK